MSALSLTYVVITYDYWMNQLSTATTTITWYPNTSSTPQQQNGGSGGAGSDNSGSQQDGQSTTTVLSTTTQAFPVYGIVLIAVVGGVCLVGLVGGIVFGAVKLVIFLKTTGAPAAAVGSSTAPLI